MSHSRKLIKQNCFAKFGICMASKSHLSFLRNRFRSHLFFCVLWEFIKFARDVAVTALNSYKWANIFQRKRFQIPCFVFGCFVLFCFDFYSYWNSMKRTSFNFWIKIQNIFITHSNWIQNNFFLCVASMKSTPDVRREKNAEADWWVCDRLKTWIHWGTV